MNKKIGIIGASPAGLTAAYLLAKNQNEVIVFESDAKFVGGISRTEKYKGPLFDIGGHRFFSKSKEVNDFWQEILGPEQLLTDNRNAVTPDSPTGKAFTYACNRWNLMYEYLHDGKLLPDNNGAERTIRPETLYRKNSLFAGNEQGARRAALFFSLLETCKLNNIDPFEYLCDVYDRIYDCPAHELHMLLPNNWKSHCK